MSKPGYFIQGNSKNVVGEIDVGVRFTEEG